MDIRPPAPPSNKPRDREWSQKYMGSEETKVRSGPLEWWYRLTAPATPPLSATLAQRELARRGRLASTILFFLIIVLLLVLPIGIFGPNHAILPIISIILALVLISIVLNRRGKSNIAGLILSCSINLALVAVIISNPTGLAASILGLFDLLVFSELFVASLLPVNWVFLSAALNIAFIIFDLTTQRRAPNFVPIINADFYPILVRPIILHVIVTVVLWLWVRSATQAIARADRAEVIATLEHAIAEQEHVVAQQKRQLDVSIQQIVETHRRVANGDFNARVPLTSENILWQIAGSLNNLLSRLQRLRRFEQEMQNVLPQLQRLRQESQELYRTKEEIGQLAAAVRKARVERSSAQLSRTGTFLDTLVVELNALSQTPSKVGTSLNDYNDLEPR